MNAKHIISILAFLSIKTILFGQSAMDTECIRNISAKTKEIVFTKYKDPISLQNDTFHFDYNFIVLRNASPEAVLIVQQGLLFPALISGASTNGDGKFQMPSSHFIGTYTISSLEEVKLTSQPPHTKTFSFLVWKEHWANPSLYIFQLSNNIATAKTNISEFIKGAHLSAFGFCSILI